MASEKTSGVEFTDHPLAERVLTSDACAFLADLERSLRSTRAEVLAARVERQRHFDAGYLPDFLAETRPIREGEWQVHPAPPGLVDRRVEITGPTDRKMMINAFNSGAKVFMADLEDANSPTWDNMVTGQANLQDAVRHTIELVTPERRYELGEEIATLVVRPRGWHLSERHFLVDGSPISASLFDFGLYAFHNAQASLEHGIGPYFYLAKLEGHLEARLWRQAFEFAEHRLGLATGTIRATVLIETILGAFEMDEILYELRENICGLNAGRWDYIFSVAKKFALHPGFVLPDRSSVTMTVPFMRSYTNLLVATCHKRGAHAIGGMAAFIPNRREPDVTARALEQVTEDKRREANDGCDGTWVAHPDLVETARAQFDLVLGSRPNQLDRLRDDVTVNASQLLDVSCPKWGVTAEGLRRNVSVGLRYLISWLSGVGAAAIDNLMEDAATAEISRAQIWQWCRHGVVLESGEQVTDKLVASYLDAEMERLGGLSEADAALAAEARSVFEAVSLAEEFVPFLTLPAYELLD